VFVGLVAMFAASVGTSPASATQTDAELAAAYRPILRFDASERWRPLEIESFLAESLASRTPHRGCGRGGTCVAVADSVALLSASALDIAGNSREGNDYVTPNAGSCARPGLVVDCDSGPRSAIYYQVSHRVGRAVIDYWWFLRFNDFPRADAVKCRNLIFVGVISCSDHEGDWEGVRVIVKPGQAHRPTVLFDAHGRAEHYSAVAVERVAQRPVVYVAEGTHASYPQPCSGKYCVQTGARLPEGGVDGKRAWGRNTVQACGRTCLLPLTEQRWARWPGLWGRACNSRGCVRVEGPRSPGVQSHRARACESSRTEFAPVSARRAAQMANDYRRRPTSLCGGGA
jgi:hypothetical protein